MALGGLQHPVGNQTALKSVYACRCTRLGRVTSTRRLRVRVVGNANRRAGCVTSAPLLAQRGGGNMRRTMSPSTCASEVAKFARARAPYSVPHAIPTSFAVWVLVLVLVLVSRARAAPYAYTYAYAYAYVNA